MSPWTTKRVMLLVLAIGLYAGGCATQAAYVWGGR
jgi:hypothetical protein